LTEQIRIENATISPPGSTSPSPCAAKQHCLPSIRIDKLVERFVAGRDDFDSTGANARSRSLGVLASRATQLAKRRARRDLFWKSKYWNRLPASEPGLINPRPMPKQPDHAATETPSR